MNSHPFYYHRQLQGYIGLNPQIVNWKPLNTPQGVMSGSIQPLHNKDYSNTTIYKHGLPRPIHNVWRQGNNVANQSFSNSSIAHRGIQQTMDAPSSFTTSTYSRPLLTIKDGIPLCVSDMIPNYNLTNNPEPTTCSELFCCNPEKKARRMSLAANTIKKNNYFTNTNQYLYKRNKTFSQNSFHYLVEPTHNNIPNTTSHSLNNYKPGGPISTIDNYTYNTNSNCILGIKGNSECTKKTIYHPNNYTFAQQGPVTDRTHNLNLILNTLASSRPPQRRVF